MGSVYRFVASFFDIRHGIKARIFLSFLAVTIIFTVIISIYWYQRIIQSTTDAILENMEKNVNSSLAQIENGFEDVKRMHYTVVYESNSMNYLVRDIDEAPTADWFVAYSRLYNSLKMMGVTMSRTVAGTGIFKANGSTCLSGTLSLPFYFPQLEESAPIREGKGGDVIFFLDKLRGDYFAEISKNIFLGRAIIDKGQEKALIVSKINERIITDALREVSYHEGFSLVLDREYNIIYDNSPGRYSGYKDDFRRQLAQGNELLLTPGYTAFHKTSEYMDVTVLSSMPNQYLRERYRTIRTQLVLIVLVVVLGEALLSMLISNKITLGLRSLEHNMQQISDGVIAESLPLGGDDEVGRLSRTYLHMIAQIKKLMEDIKENEGQKREMEIKVLRAQVSPHFLYNSLNTIGYLALMQNAKNIHGLVVSLIDLLHGAVNVDDVMVPLAAEIRYVKSYLNIQQYRYLRQIQAEFRMDSMIDHYRVPKMILQPIVENALIHGLKAEQENPSITVKVYALGEKLIISVTDNGSGIPEGKVDEIMADNAGQGQLRFTGHGLSNVHARIRLQFGDEYGLSIYSREQLFTTVEIRLPLLADPGEQPP